MRDSIPNIASSDARAPLRVLVVGADGFMGHATAAAQVRRGRRVVAAADRDGLPLPPLCRSYAAWLFALGWPAFASILAIFSPTALKPDL